MTDNSVAREEVVLKKISVIKLALLSLIWHFFLGLVSGAIFFILIKLAVIAMNITTPVLGLVLLCFIALPMGSAIMGFIFVLIIAGINNLFLKMIGGVSIVFEEKVQKQDNTTLPSQLEVNY